MSAPRTRGWFFALVAALAAQRLVELRTSRRNERALRAAGAVEHAPRQLPAIVALHAAWLVAMPLEVVALDRRATPLASSLALGAFAAGQALRRSAMRALGPRWSAKILVVPGSRLVSHGPYRALRHPNYLGVWLETVALPLVHGAVWTSAAFGAAQALMLGARIRAEEAALSGRDRAPDRARGRAGRRGPRSARPRPTPPAGPCPSP
jgi:methyltransferase